MNDGVRVSRWVATVAIVTALALGGIVALGLRNWSGSPVFAQRVPAVAVARDVAPIRLGEFSNGFSSVIKPALPAVVNIHSSKVVKQKAGSMPFNDPFFRQFFGDQFGQQFQPHAEREQSLGSGVIVTSDGTILTNNHVIDGATDVKVDLSDKREFPAKVIGTDPKTDIAVLKINATGLPTLTLGDSSKLDVGDVIFAIGDPFGIGETATMGIVSATGRGLGGAIEKYEDFIQTDAAINPGNSGGAMIDLHGNLVGINTAILSHGSGGNEGIGFAIPINMARSVMDQIVTHGKVVRGYLGVYIQDVTPQIARAFNLKQAGGVLVGDVTPNTPAAQAGLKKGDVILAVNGDTVNDRNQLSLRIAQMSPGTTVKLTISREGQTLDLNVKLAELPEKEVAAEQGESSSGALEGVEVQNLTADITQELNLPTGTRGVVVTTVDPASAAAAAGLNRGMVIQEVNHKPVNTVNDYKQALASAGKEQPVLLLVNQGGVTNYVVIEPN